MKTGSQISHYYPIFLKIGGKKCVVIGGGQVALRKVSALLEHEANVEVISPGLCPELSQLKESGMVHVVGRDYVTGDLKDALLVVAATDDGEINQKVAAEAQSRGVLINVVDDPHNSDFIVPSYLRRGSITIAVSTGGSSPALARSVRAKIERSFGAEYASLAMLVGEVRAELKQRGISVDSDVWQEVLNLDSLITLVQDGQIEEAKSILFSDLEKAGRREP